MISSKLRIAGAALLTLGMATVAMLVIAAAGGALLGFVGCRARFLGRAAAGRERQQDCRQGCDTRREVHVVSPYQPVPMPR